MGSRRPLRTFEPKPTPLAYELPRLKRKRPRCYEEWSALRRWGRLPEQEEDVVGFQLRESRELAGHSQKELARKLGCSQQAVSQAERWSSNPTVGFLRDWAEAVGADLRITLVETPDPTPRSASPPTS